MIFLHKNIFFVKLKHLVWIIILLFGCSNKNTKIDSQPHSLSNRMDSILQETEECCTLPVISDSIKKDKSLYVDFLTDHYKEGITDLIQLGFNLYDITESRASFITEGSLAYYTLPGSLSINALQNKYNNMFHVEKIELQENHYKIDEPFYHKLSYKDSYIKVHHLKYEGWDSDQYHKVDDDHIVCAVIKNEEIVLLDSIHIGMPKEDFFYNKLGLKIPLSIDTLDSGCSTGEIQQQFIFKANRLEKVLITTYYDFADFQFK